MLYIIDLTNISNNHYEQGKFITIPYKKNTILIAKRGIDFVAKSENTRIGNRTYEKSINSNCASTG
jgi:hypothetical protein